MRTEIASGLGLDDNASHLEMQGGSAGTASWAFPRQAWATPVRSESHWTSPVDPLVSVNLRLFKQDRVASEGNAQTPGKGSDMIEVDLANGLEQRM